ncbi:cytokinin dehydrogenase 2-like [Rutidosis leptorrhynchoides]|uniref:cytokinin dehydrogenase 2-like n=1 Tax=Rutidosis leptorrhynchoides TaxID=125765 RepID=UPI003A999408
MGHPHVLIVAQYLFLLFTILTTTSSVSIKLPTGPLRKWGIKLCNNASCIDTASTDYGNIVHEIPYGVFYPSSVSDVVNLVKSSYESPAPFTIAARGNGHSVRGQAMAKDGVVVEMASLNTSITVSGNSSSGTFYVDVGGEQLWIDVLRATLKHGLAPVSWTDYLYLTVGGTLSNAGISGQTSFHGPQISNVLEMDVITGKGELITCSEDVNPDLFYAVLGGLGQFGIITRARIVLKKAPTRVKWVRMMYDDFSKFSKDQEHLISIQGGMDYVEGNLMMDTTSSTIVNFYSPYDVLKINHLAPARNGSLLYTLEVAKYYDTRRDINTIDKELEMELKGLSYKPGLIFSKDISFFDFLNRVGNLDHELQTIRRGVGVGVGVVRHPWLNFFVPRSRIVEFNQRVFVEILQNQGLYLVYPINRKKWDDRMSVIIPDDDDDDDEDMFYTVGLLFTSQSDDDFSRKEKQNNEILQFCSESGINIKQYFPHYVNKQDWMKHFGNKWDVFQQRKAQFDPKMILSPGQTIFTSA